MFSIPSVHGHRQGYNAIHLESTFGTGTPSKKSTEAAAVIDDSQPP
uniref:Uncharacterized protein n=1 Tax=Anguilla anguilla TaxID=7936 RepID=A0A0E9XV38_ANGAN